MRWLLSILAGLVLGCIVHIVSIFALPHLGQTGCVEPLTSNSDSFPHSRQAYS